VRGWGGGGWRRRGAAGGYVGDQEGVGSWPGRVEREGGEIRERESGSKSLSWGGEPSGLGKLNFLNKRQNLGSE